MAFPFILLVQLWSWKIIYVDNMENNTKQKIILGIAGATMLLGGIGGVDLAVQSDTEILSEKLAEYNLEIKDIIKDVDDTQLLKQNLSDYNLEIKDITPFSDEKILVAINSKDFTKNEELALESILRGREIVLFSDGNINIDDYLNIQSGLANKIGININEVENMKSTLLKEKPYLNEYQLEVSILNKLIRQKINY